MAKLFFRNSRGVERQIADCDTWPEVSKCINLFIDQANVGKPKNRQFKSYYMRLWEEDGRTKIDVGSWSEFFYWEGKIGGIQYNMNEKVEFDYDNESSCKIV